MRSLCLAALLFVCSLGARAQLPDFTELVEKYGPAVVNVSTTSAPRARAGPRLPNVPEDDPFYEFFRRFMPQIPGPREFESQSLGSGFIISADGYVLTNAHVVEAADEITVKLNDKREFKAKVIGSDRKTDIALLKIDATGLPAVQIGDPSKVKVGEWVIAIGSPFGFESTVTAGIVSAKGRSLPQENFVPFIQTDVAVNPGNSGGPLFNLRGEVIGVNTALAPDPTTGGVAQGIGFAVGVDSVSAVWEQLRDRGRVDRGYLGITGFTALRPATARSLGIPADTGGIYLAGADSVVTGGPVFAAGVRSGDVITKIGNATISTEADLAVAMIRNGPNTTVTVEVYRGSQRMTFNVKLGTPPTQ